MDSRISIITLAVTDLEKSFDFYSNGLGLKITRKPEDGIIFYQTLGTCFALYPKNKMNEEMKTSLTSNKSGEIFGGFTLAHNVKRKEEVDSIIQKAKSAGAIVEKEPADNFWGGYSGYFSDPDGYLWKWLGEPLNLMIMVC